MSILLLSTFAALGDVDIPFFEEDLDPSWGAAYWTMDMEASDTADAYFYGEGSMDEAGHVSYGGDVNGDGFNDILIGVPFNEEGMPSMGQVYVIFGGKTGWSMDTNLSNANASFIGGSSICGAGDVNKDGYDDILIGDLGSRSVHLFFGRPTGEWMMDMTLSEVNASFIPEPGETRVGESMCGAGDVNGDGYDDFLIGDAFNGETFIHAGQTYLILGKDTSQWSLNNMLSDADASFQGEAENDESGILLAGGGDVNKDGYDDFLIGAPTRNMPMGEFYLFLGKSTGWSMDTSLSNADASYEGEGECTSMDIDGDFNNDGYDDILIGGGNVDAGASLNGKTYVVLGKRTGWSMNRYLSNSYISIIGEEPSDHCGWSVSNAGDVNKDGFDDILVGAMGNGENGFLSGQVYIIYGKIFQQQTSIDLSEADVSFLGEGSPEFLGTSVSGLGDVNGDGIDDIIMAGPHVQSDNPGNIYLAFGISSTDPLSVSSVETYTDPDYSIQAEAADVNDLVYIELTGVDGNSSTWDQTLVNISFSESSTKIVQVRLWETGANTGVYRNFFRIPLSSEYLETITFSSRKDPSKNDTIIVNTDILIGPFYDNKTATEDKEYRESYWNYGWSDQLTWLFTTDKDWLKFDPVRQELWGNPDNGDVGITLVNITLKDNQGNSDEHLFIISVENVAPIMTGEDIIAVDQGEYYESDYNCDDDGQGNVTYYVTTDSEWLQMGRYTGTLSGTPGNEDIGTTTVQVSVHDGNEGWDSREFLLMVSNVNDAPVIISDDIVTVSQDDPYVRNYQAEDIDVGDELRWKLNTDAEFLSIDPVNGTLSGTPGYMDIGSYFVNVSVWDLSDAFDSHNFTLEVLNINDVPIWTDFPSDPEVVHGQTFLFDINTTDHDGDLVTYYISSTPDSDITIDEITGLINWTADLHLFDQAPYKLEVKVSARDGHVYLNRSFMITVLATDPPTVELLGPANGMKSSSTGTVLSWEGADPENEPITYDIYLHQTQTFIQGLREEALYESDYEGDNITLTSLDPGEKYYWTVIPNDGATFGTCVSGIYSFNVNYKPTFNNIEDHKVPAGTDFKYKITCTDQDEEDIPNLRYSLIVAPDGMTISEETGMIRWTPEDDQVLIHSVTVAVSDGIDTNTATFEIDVVEGEDPSTSSLLVVIIIIVLAVIIIVVGIFFFMKKKKKMDEEALKKGEEERAALEKEKEGDVTTYEELYGAPAPVQEHEDEEITTEELRDSIHEQIEKLEQMEEMPSQEDDLLDQMISNANIETDDEINRGVDDPESSEKRTDQYSS